MTEQQLIQSTLRDALARAADLRLAMMFGSVARGEARANSDVDVAVLADHTLSADERIRLVESIAQATGRAVDLVDLTTAGPPLLGEILRDGIRLLGSPAELAALATRAALDAADFLPLVQRMLKQRRLAWTA
jgi:predicted nucleotidyltransferase